VSFGGRTAVLHVHRSSRADALVQALGGALSEPLADPFAPEVVAVPTRGMERWVAQRLSARLGVDQRRADGVCANVLFPSLSSLVRDAVATASGVEPDDDPWTPERAVWPLLEVVDSCLEEPWLAVLAAHLGAGEDVGAAERRARRFGAVRHLADLFDRYALHRPEMVRGWRAGEGGEADGQAELWRRLRSRLAVASPAERVGAACARLRDEPELLDLPTRLGLFGLTRLPAGHLAVLRALAVHRDVHLYLLHPSPALWDTVATALAGEQAVVRRSADPTVDLPANRLLASWGQDARELQLVVTNADGGHQDHHHPAPVAAPATLLQHLQAAVRADAEPPDDGRAVLTPGDRSVQVHACHGRARQVEIVREAILHELAADPTLEPRDVIVMCPDIEEFAPLIHATFGAAQVAEDEDTAPLADRPPDLRVRLADRSLRQTNPVLGTLAELLELANQRLTASQVLDFADRAPVRRRFGFDDDDLARIEDWVAASGIRWGLDAQHRAPFKLEALTTGTWRAGLDRVLLGVTMTEDDRRLFAEVLPLDDVESGAIDLAGRVAERVDRLQSAVDALARPQSLASWAAAIGEAADALTATAPRDAWQRAELQRMLDDVVGEAAVAGEPDHATLSLPELRALLADRLQGRPTRANFRTGHLTICTLVPMRSVPHRVVCLLGLDDAQFPRKAPRDGDDRTLDDPHVGDRDPRSEDRQLLLDALMAAQDRLIITYTGNDERTNAQRPPAVPVGELLDAVDRAARAGDDRPASATVLTRHPLQPFDPRNFAPGTLAPGTPWAFDRVTLEGARALEGPRTPPAPFLEAPLPPTHSPILELEDLVRFVERPVRAFLRQRLGISVGDYDDEIDDALSVELDALEQWGVGQRLLEARLAGADLQTAVGAELARGTLPPGHLAAPVVQGVKPIVEEIARRAEDVLEPGARTTSVDVRLTLPDGRTLSGTVAGVCGDLLRTVTYSRVGPRHRLAVWVRWLALTAAHPERPFTAATIGRGRSGTDARVTIARLPVLADDPAGRRAAALDQLAALADLHARGLREPLPLACLTSAAYAETAYAGGDPVRAATRAWESGWRFDNEDRAPEHVLAFGRTRTITDLLDETPAPDEAWHADADATRFGRYARRLWQPLLAHEAIEDR
jgi:exodeoxyribonuclease V gamma subunit